LGRLHLAAWDVLVVFVLVLLESGANANARDVHGLTLLQMALGGGHGPGLGKSFVCFSETARMRMLGRLYAVRILAPTMTKNAFSF
jgi:hypothetical protein